MLMSGAPLSDGALLQKLVLGAGTMAIVSVGAWTADTLRDLTAEVQALRLSMVQLSARVDGLPPREVLSRIEMLEKDHQEMHQRLDTMARRIHKKMGVEE